MTGLNPFALNQSVSITVQSEQTRVPFAARVSLRRLSQYVVAMAATYAITLTGTLLFFRELELNRKLQEHVLKLETERRLYQAYPLPDRGPAQTVAHPLPETTTPAVVVASAPISIEPTAVVTHADVSGRINELRADCVGEDCAVRIGMVNNQTGTAVGQLLVVLEAEVPRIGTATPGSPVRKRYFLYPGNQALDELDPNQLGTYQQKAFRFSRALQTSTVFHLGKLLRPLAVNVYVFDPERSLIQHERKAIDPEE